jgi:hypothetical protein
MERVSTLKLEVLKKYMGSVFIETGTYDASGTLVAVEAGFPFIITMEISPRLFWFSYARLRTTKNVMALMGDSAILLPKVLEGVNVQATFWLDAHQPQDNTRGFGYSAQGYSWSNCPLRIELLALKEHEIKNHFILIDDVDHFGTGHMDGVTLDEVKKMILDINPAYQFTLEDGNTTGSILAAYVP